MNLPPWRIDPCQLEARGGTEEVVRLLQGRLRVVWNHGGNISPYKLSLTVLGRGLPCLQNNKHPCLTFGYVFLFSKLLNLKNYSRFFFIAIERRHSYVYQKIYYVMEFVIAQLVLNTLVTKMLKCVQIEN